MNVTVVVYQERRAAEYFWTTVGLGEHALREHGPNPGRIQQKLSDALRDKLSKLAPRELASFELVRGTRLETPHLEFSLRHEGRKRKVSLVCPIVVEPRWAGDFVRFVIAYHPARQERWFPVHEEATLAEQAAAFFAEDWAALDDDAVGELRLRGKAMLRSFSFNASPRSLLDELPDRPKGVWDDLRNDKDSKGEKRRKVLKQVGVDATWKAIDGAITGGVPRPPFRDQLRMMVCSAPRQPAIVVGPPGSGRTTLIERAVLDLLEADEYASHRNADKVHHVWRVSGRRIIAGMSYLGEWQQRCLDVVAEAREKRAILWVEDLAQWGRVGRTRDSESNLAEFFHGPVARREVVLLGECSPEELRQLEEDAPAFAGLFQRLNLPPADTAETLRMLLHEVRRLELAHGRLRCDVSMLVAVLELGAPLVPTRAFPGKALDLLRAVVRDAVADGDLGDPLSEWHVRRTLHARTGLPLSLLASDEPLSPDDVARDLSARVMGQPEAINAAVDLVMRVRAGLADPKRPYGVYLFTGPTGTGKTELAKALATYLYGGPERLVRVDMGEYGTPDAASRLVGDRWNPEGVLTRALQAQPFSVVLLDEIEKAHPRVHNLLLQLFDEARLTDAAGVPASFAHAVVVMTSNLGARSDAVVGFGAGGALTEAEYLRAVREFFSPELFNRIDRVVPFRALTPEVARAVVARELSRLTARRGLLDRNVFVTASGPVLDRVVREAFRAADGARSLKRWLEDRVGTLLTEHLVRSAGSELQIVRLRDDGDGKGGLSLDVETLREAEPMDARFPLEECLTEPLPRLMGRLADARRELDAVASSPGLAALSERIRALLAGHRRGERDRAGELFTLESMRGEIARLGESLEGLARAAIPEEDWDLRGLEIIGREISHQDAWGTERSRVFDRRAFQADGVAPTRAEALAALAEVGALRRALATLDDPTQHAVIVEVARATPPEFLRDGPPLEDGGLFEQLTAAYARARGVVDEAWALDGRSGTFFELAPPLDEWLARHAAHVSRIALRVSGLCVRDFFEPEAGTHVWRPLAGVPEIVRVWVRPAGADEGAEAALRASIETARLEDARRGLSSPESALPVVRTIRFEPAPQQGAPAPFELEDYRMATTRAVSSRNLVDPLMGLWLVRLARVTD